MGDDKGEAVIKEFHHCQKSETPADFIASKAQQTELFIAQTKGKFSKKKRKSSSALNTYLQCISSAFCWRVEMRIWPSKQHKFSIPKPKKSGFS